MRIRIVSLCLGFIFAALALSLFNLQVIQAGKFKDLSNKNCIRLLPQEGARGRIIDRNGSVMVDNRLSYDVMVLPQEGMQVNSALRRVSSVLGTDYNELILLLRKNISRQFLPQTIARNIEAKKAIALEELRSDLPGLVIKPHPLRYYPYSGLASHLIGYLNEIDRWRLTKLQDYGYKTKDIVGFGGVEEKYDYYLRQEEGGLSVEVDHQGRFVRILGYKPPENGKDIQLTVDLAVQKIAESVLAGRKGSVIIMEPYSGEIIAMAGGPGFNPSVFVKKSGRSISGLFNDPDAPMINRSISAAYPAGSVFKLVVAAAAMENGKINSSTSFFCQGGINLGAREFSCWSEHGQQNLTEAITHSCNVFFYRIGLLCGAQAIHDYAVRFGFSRPTSIDLPYETGGIVPNPLWRKIYRFQNWFDGDTANFSIGQGDLLVTPVQVARMMAVFANRGSLVIPHVIKAIDGQDLSAYYRNKISRVAVKEKTLDSIRLGLRRVVQAQTGTANNLSVLAVSVAGKTGTAQVASGESHGWFAGFFPFDRPKYVICAFLEHGRAGHAASELTRQIIEEMSKEGLI